MLRELIAILRSDNPLKPMGDNFNRMFQLTKDMALDAGTIFFEGNAPPERRTRLYETDVEVNKLERVIRKQVVAHLSVAGNSPDLPYCLRLMSLVKDVERLGDYAKNLSELVDMYAGELPQDDVLKELKEIRKGVEEAFVAAADILDSSDTERAIEFIRKGRDFAHRCDALIQKISRTEYDAGTTTAVVLATRYYKRFAGHVLNILSSVVMPLHKLDYYDEDEIPEKYR
jgi:phosphate transport system protein